LLDFTITSPSSRVRIGVMISFHCSYYCVASQGSIATADRTSTQYHLCIRHRLRQRGNTRSFSRSLVNPQDHSVPPFAETQLLIPHEE
jgi:hypothetical protein